MSKKSILIAEDEIIVSLDLKQMLQKNNFEVLTVSSGEDLIVHAQLKVPDLIIADFNLKGKIKGKDALFEIRRFIDSPIILISGSSESKLNTFADRIFSCYYITKPFEPSKLLNLVNKLI